MTPYSYILIATCVLVAACDDEKFEQFARETKLQLQHMNNRIQQLESELITYKEQTKGGREGQKNTAVKKRRIWTASISTVENSDRSSNSNISTTHSKPSNIIKRCFQWSSYYKSKITYPLFSVNIGMGKPNQSWNTQILRDNSR